MRNLRAVRLKNVMAGGITVGDLLEEEDMEADITTNTHLHHSRPLQARSPLHQLQPEFTMKFNVQL